MKAKFPPLSARLVVLRFPNPPPAWEGRRVDHVILAVWTIGILIWTVARFIIPVVVFWQFLRMLWYWNTPDVHAGWQFLAYYAVYIALYIFFGVYEPKLYREKNRGRPNG